MLGVEIILKKTNKIILKREEHALCSHVKNNIHAYFQSFDLSSFLIRAMLQEVHLLTYLNHVTYC